MITMTELATGTGIMGLGFLLWNLTLTMRVEKLSDDLEALQAKRNEESREEQEKL